MLNLLVLAAIFFGFVNIGVRLPADSMFTGAMGERLQLLPYLVGRDLSDHPRAQWDQVLAGQARRRGVELFLLSPDGRVMAGGKEAPPAAVRQRAARYFAERRPLAGPAGRGRPPGAVPFAMQGRRPPPHPLPPGAPVDRPAPFFMQTKDPDLYWAGVPILVAGRLGFPSLHGVLVVSSDSLTGRGLFFDPLPWLVSIAGVVLFSALWWWPLIRSITRPLAQVTNATEQIAVGRFDLDLPEGRRDEIGRLSQAIKRMAVRLKALIQGHKQFLGGVAHELTSPVARIKLGLGVLEQQIPEALKPKLRSVMEDAEHMSGLLDELLSFSRAEISPSRADLRNVALLPLAERALAREGQPGADISLRVPEGLAVHADPELLVTAMCNLIRNAVRYAGLSGPILVEASRDGDAVRIAVSDNGPGVPPEDLPRIFEPFHRSDAGGPGGVGLGLSMVRTCVQACRGRVSARNRPEGGLEVVLELEPGR